MKTAFTRAKGILLQRWWFWIPVIMLLLWGLFKFFKRGLNNSSGAESPIEILRRRYANGDIGTEEFERRRKMLSPGLLLEGHR